ncbi:putative ribonuclease H-like domain-containing protein [Tanacetum coccineum]
MNGLEDLLDDGDSLVAKNLTVKKSKEELDLFEALDHKSVVVKEGSHRVVVFKKVPPRAYSKPFTRFSLPCDVDGQGTWDAELDMADSFNYITEERFDMLGFIRVDYGDYGRKMVKEVRAKIHGFTFLVDFVMIGYANEGEPSVIFGRDFLVTSKSMVDFGIGEMRIDLTMHEEMKDLDVMLDALVENLEEVGSSNGDLVKMGKASQKVKEALDRKYKELEESKPILELLENYITHQKKVDEVLIGRSRLSNDEYSEEEKMRIVEHGLPKKMCDPGNFVLLVRVNETVEMSALADTGASMSVLPYCVFKNLGLGDPKPYNSNLTMAENTQSKAMGEAKNLRIQIGYQAYLVGFLVLDIPVDKELPLLLGHPFLRACGAVIDIGRDEEDDWLSCFEVGRDKDGNPKYGPVAPLFLDIEDDMERALALEAYLNPFKNIIVFKKLIDFLGSRLVQLKNTDWGNEGHGTYKKVEGDGTWHTKFKVITPSGQKFTRGFKTKETNRKLSGKFTSEDILKFDHFLD